MNKIDLVKISLPLKHKFKISQGEASVKINYLAILNNRYIGEASGSVYYGPTLDEIEADLKRGAKFINQQEKIDLELLQAMRSLDINSISKSALSGMLLNYLSGESKRYPWEILNLGTPLGIKSSFTFGIKKPSDMLSELNSSEYPIIKLKMGHEEDILLLDIIDQIKDKEIRVDANGGWSCSKAEEMIFHLTQKGVKIIEQPTSHDFISEWLHIKGKSKTAELIVDEGMNSIDDYHSVSAYVDGVNIKMEKSGGIIEGLEIAQQAIADKKKVMLGCMVESSVGIAQSLYLSSRADYFDLDGPLLLENDIATGIKYDKETIEVDREIIGGPKLKREILEKYISN